mgnify:FL=1
MLTVQRGACLKCLNYMALVIWVDLDEPANAPLESGVLALQAYSILG